MKVAVSISGAQVSPTVDLARGFLVAEVESGQLRSRAVHPIAAPTGGGVPEAITSLGVGVLICGEIAAELEQRLRSQGVRVIPHRWGDADEILSTYIAGGFDDPRRGMGCVTWRADRREREAGRRRIGADDGFEWGCCDPVEIRVEQRSVDRLRQTTRRWIAEVGSRRVGTLCLDHDRMRGWIRRFDIDPDFQHSAAPCRLVQQALSYCRRMGLIKVTLEGTIPVRAMRLFACLGFQQTKRAGHGGRGAIEFYMNLYRVVDEARCAGEIVDRIRSVERA